MLGYWELLVGFLPTWAQAAILVLIALFLVIIVVKVVGAILDAIPFV